MISKINFSVPAPQASPFLDLPKEIQVEIVVIALQNGHVTGILNSALVSKEIAQVTRTALTRILDKLEQSLPDGLLRSQIAFLPFEVKDLNEKDGLAFLRVASLFAKVMSVTLGCPGFPKNFLVENFLKLHQHIKIFPSKSGYYPGGTNSILFWRWNGAQIPQNDENVMQLWKGNDGRNGFNLTALSAVVALISIAKGLSTRIPAWDAPAKEIREFMNDDENRPILSCITQLTIPNTSHVTALPAEINNRRGNRLILLRIAADFPAMKALPDEVKELGLFFLNIPENMAVPPKTYKNLWRRKSGMQDCYID